jgi:TnpA family transposase
LIDKKRWQQNKVHLLRETELLAFADGDAYLDSLKKVIDDRYTQVNERFLAGDNPYMSVDEKDYCRVRTPKIDSDDESFIAATLSQNGYVPILQVLREVNRVCDFIRCFKHLSPKHHKMKPTEEMLMAGILGKGCNIGIGKLASISAGIREHTLHNTVTWYFDIKNIRSANRKIVDVIHRLALPNNYLNEPSVIHSSSDGRKVNVAVDCLHASYSYKYFGKEKGVTDYTFIDERQSLFHNTVFSASDREAPYVIDGLVDNPVPEGRVHSTDTHGFSESIFATTHFIGVAFAPRLKNLGRQKLYGFSTRASYRKRDYKLLPSRSINRKLILRHWDDILRFMTTIKTHHASASQLFKRLSSYAKDHPLYRALKEFGRIIKTQFILTYYDDVELRQQIHKQLNRVEQANKFSHAVFFDNDQAFQEGSRDDQELVNACKMLLQNAIILWNYLYLSELVVNTPNRKERSVLFDTIRGGSVITWKHINLRGEYDFRRKAANDPIFDFRRIKALRIS